MKRILANKTAGFYITVVSSVLALAALIGFMLWAPAHNAMNPIIPIALGGGILLNLLLSFINIEYVAIGSCALFSIALFTLISDSVGSFVDAIQGIVMFGDSTQLGIIITLSVFMLLAVLTTIIACFMGRVKAAK